MTTIKELIQELVALLKQYLARPEAKEVKSPEPKATQAELFRNKAVLLIAAAEIGVKEVPGKGDNPRIKEYHAYSTIKNLLGMSDSVPWCASFIAWVLEKSGMTSTNSKMARSYEKWGVSTKLAPLPGDVIVFYRDSLKSGFGHVGIFLKKTPKGVYVLGGNQSDSVNVALFSTAKMTDIRRSSRATKYTADQIEDLNQIASQIIAGHDVASAGSLT